MGEVTETAVVAAVLQADDAHGIGDNLALLAIIRVRDSLVHLVIENRFELNDS